MKQAVATYDYVTYYETVSKVSINNYANNLNSSSKNVPSHITRAEVISLLRMFDASMPELRKSSDRTNINAIISAGAAKMNMKEDSYIKLWVLSHNSLNYYVDNINESIYADITYNYEDGFKYTESLKYR